MNLARHSITSTNPVHVFDAHFDADCQIFTVSTPAGFAVYRTWPLDLLRKRELTEGTLAIVLPLHASNLLFLVGGGRCPLYPPNKVIVWDDVLSAEVAELEFREKVRGIACRRGWLVVALRRRVIAFEIGEQITRFQEWSTSDNIRGLVSLSANSSSLIIAIPSLKVGHVQVLVISEPPQGSPSRSPATKTWKSIIIQAHTNIISTLSLSPAGRLLATTSAQGTLIRVWDTSNGSLLREFRRGIDKAEIYGVAFRPDEKELCVWSDKGTVHVFNIMSSGASNRHSSFSRLKPYLWAAKYLDYEWSYAQYRIPVQSSHISLSPSALKSSNADEPDEERCVVGWIQVPVEGCDLLNPKYEYQLVALTFAGGWYRLSLPNAGSAVEASTRSPPSSPSERGAKQRPRTSSASSVAGRSGKGKEKEREKDQKESRECTLQEFRRFGRWDGWG